MEADMFMQGERPEAFMDFPLYATDYEPINLFNWQEKVKRLISQLEFVRMVDVQSETVSRYIREGRIKADLEVPFSSGTFKYFKEETVRNYAQQFGWELINASNMKDKFLDMVKTMDMSFSYKPVLLKAMLKYANSEGKVFVDDIVEYFIDFYNTRRKLGYKAEKENSLFSREVTDRKAAEKNIFANPFKHFEDMRFMKRCRDVEYVEFNSIIWKRLSGEEREWIVDWCDRKLEEYFKREYFRK